MVSATSYVVVEAKLTLVELMRTPEFVVFARLFGASAQVAMSVYFLDKKSSYVGGLADRHPAVVERRVAGEERVALEAELVRRVIGLTQHFEALVIHGGDELARGRQPPVLLAESEGHALGAMTVAVDGDFLPADG